MDQQIDLEAFDEGCKSESATPRASCPEMDPFLKMDEEEEEEVSMVISMLSLFPPCSSHLRRKK